MSLAAALARLPLFPLPGVTIFPGQVVPLHVFEPRYRQMTRDALATHRALALACVLPGAVDAQGHPPIPRIVGAGTIVEHEALPDGRFHLLLRGEARVELVELPFTPPYRVARARIAVDPGPPVPDHELAALSAVARAIARIVKKRAPEIDLALPAAAPPDRLADLLAARMVPDAEARQALIEQPSAAQRTATLLGMLSAQLQHLQGVEGGVAN